MPETIERPDTQVANVPTVKPFDEEQFMEYVAEGKGLREIGKLPGMPWKREVWVRLTTDPDFQSRYARAKQRAADTFAEEIISISDEEPRTVEERVDSGHVQWQRNRVDARKWVAAKLMPKKYGDRVDVEHSGAVATLSAGDVRSMLEGSPLLRQLSGQVIDVPQQAITE